MSNRILRENAKVSRQALDTAADMRDRAEFDRLALTNPKVFKLYESKVEKALNDLRAQGQNAPRMLLLRLAIGNDVMDGKVKGKTRKATDAGAAQANAGVDRGRSPGARSDVSSKGRQTESQKRRARLENVNI